MTPGWEAVPEHVKTEGLGEAPATAAFAATSPNVAAAASPAATSLVINLMKHPFPLNAPKPATGLSPAPYRGCP
jgi:hypothetical protein